MCKELQSERRDGGGGEGGEKCGGRRGWVSEAVTCVPHKNNTSFDGGVTC